MGFLPRRILRRIFFGDYIDYVDGLTASALAEIPIQDLLRLSDALLYLRHPTVQLSDSIGISDRLLASKQSSVRFEDQIPATDTLSYLRHPVVQFGDRIAIGDLYIPSRRVVLLFRDSADFSDQLPSSKRSSVELRDQVSVTDWFFRLKKGLELRDLTEIADGMHIMPVNVKLFSDYVLIDDALISNVYPIIVFTDSVDVLDKPEFYKSISPFFASLLYQRPKRRHVSQIIYDRVAFADYISTRAGHTVLFGDSVPVGDSISYVKSISPLFASLLYQRPRIRYRILHLADILNISDIVTPIRGYTVRFEDVILADLMSYVKSISPLFVSMLYRRPKRRYMILYLTDVLGISDVFTPIRGYTVRFEDVILADVFEVRTTPTVLFSDFINAEDWIPNYPHVMYYGIYATMAHRYLTFKDRISVSDSLEVGPPNVVVFRDHVSVSDLLTIKPYGTVTFSDEIRFAEAIDAHVNIRGVVFRDRIEVRDLTTANRS